MKFTSAWMAWSLVYYAAGIVVGFVLRGRRDAAKGAGDRVEKG